MPQLSLYLDDETMLELREDAAQAGMSLSKFTAKALKERKQKSGNAIGPNDTLIAAMSLANHATLVTHNQREFSRVSGLHLEDWTEVHL